MKVCTDSCILGAYTPVNQAQNILDIGTGTGLLALMVAQRSSAQIDAVEVNDLAAAQARENITGSPWAHRVQVHHQSLQEFAQMNQKSFDLIICNPPFYAASQHSPDKARNVAMHSQELSLAEVTNFCTRFLTPTGQLFILLPPSESRHFANLAQKADLYCCAVLNIYTTTAGKHIRLIQGFSQAPVDFMAKQNLFIRNLDNSYTQTFRDLLREYYLIF